MARNPSKAVNMSTKTLVDRFTPNLDPKPTDLPGA